MRKRGKRFTTRRDPSAFLRTLVGVKPLEQDQQTDLSIAYRMSFESLRTGHGKETDFHTIACSLNIALVLAERGYGAEWVEQVKAAQVGLVRRMERGQRTGRWGLDGEAMTAMSDALSLHDEQIALATQREIREAIAEVHRRVTIGEVFETENA
ncbi:hypothetical protein ACKZDW_08000 [Ralstonia syzygii subsp. celebesensis]|uniref:Fis family transcriptional regulator n=2 Tax=Ralstonia syzygii subsp. celebesensis TaxID=1310168 RepID=A0A1U9VD95_9RALS|nr:hypothetical protein [Ralstonia syzygii]AQW28654.1 hypothetical protein B0B51_00515 [blood disease bacterium A2-HR MARDI]CCA82221.1 hypothetical protein BDB_30038 [blood disease bacterium R229]